MRSKFSLALVALAATLAVSAAGVASASAALPEFAGTVSKAKPLEVFEEATPGLGGSTLFKAMPYTGGEYNIECGETVGKGRFETPKTGSLQYDFRACKVQSLGWKCKTPGAEAGTLKTHEFKVELVYLSKAKKEVGLHHNSRGTGYEFFAKIECANVNFGTVSGDFVGQLSALNVKTALHDDRINEVEPRSFENELGKIVVPSLIPSEWLGKPKSIAVQAHLYFETGVATEIKA